MGKKGIGSTKMKSEPKLNMQLVSERHDATSEQKKIFKGIPTCMQGDLIEIPIEFCWKEGRQRWWGLHAGCGCVYRCKIRNKQGNLGRMDWALLCEDHKRRMYRMEVKEYYAEYVRTDPRFSKWSEKQKQEDIDAFQEGE